MGLVSVPLGAMNVTCPSCKTRYSVDDARVPPSGVTIKCPKCGHQFVAKPPSARSAVALPGAVAAEPPTEARPSGVPPPQPGPAGAPVPLPGRTAPPPPQTAGGAIPLPGTSNRAVPLPGSVGTVGPNMASASTQIGDLDLGFDAEAPLPAPRGAPLNNPPIPNRPPAPRSALGGDQVMDFINDQSNLGGPPMHHPEYKVRRRNGRVEGPFGIGRLQAMLRNRELQGSEDISEDGVSWRAMTSHPDLNATLNQLHTHADPLAFGNVDLPIPAGADLPAPSELPQPRAAKASVESLDFSSDDLGSSDLGRSGPLSTGDGFGSPQALPLQSPASTGPLNAAAFDAGARSPTSTMIGDDLDGLSGNLSADLSTGSFGSSPADYDRRPLDPATSDLARELQVGDVPELPPVWQTYRSQIIAFAIAAGVVLLALVTQFATPYGIFGIPALVSWLNVEAPRPVPAAPPPAPPKVADPKELASLIDEHSYESFRSAFATLEQAAGSVADNRLTLAKARGMATLAYGPDVFPIGELTKAVDDLQSIDLSTAMRGNTNAANIAIAKARATLQILTGEPDRAGNQLARLVDANSGDKELALLLGAARSKLGKHAAAAAAYDKALVVDAGYAPALHAMGKTVEAIGGPKAAKDAVQWYVKALDANPKHSRSGIEAARLYQTLRKNGDYRRRLKQTAAHVNRGLPPAERPAFLHRVAQVYDDQGRLAEVAQHAIEAARLQPGTEAYVALGAVAMAETGAAQEGLEKVSAVLSRNPNSVDALIARARTYVKLDDIAKGFIDLENARKASPNDPRIPLWEARFHIDLGKFNDARKALKRAVKLAGPNPMPHVGLGELELRLGDIDAAFESAKLAVQTAPNEARAHRVLGECYSRRGQLKEAEQSFERAFSLDDENIAARLGYANSLRDQGAKQAAPKTSAMLAKAIPLYLKAMNEQPDNPQTMFEYGRALELQGDLKGALALYEGAAALDAKDVRPHLKIVAAHIDPPTVDLTAARASLKVAQRIELSGGLQMAEVRYWEARVAFAAERPREAVAAMRRAVDAEPMNPEYHFWMGRVKELNNSLYEAVTHYERAVKLNSRFAEAIRALGRTALERKLFDKARTYFQRYQKAAPDDHSIHVDIGDSYTMQNRDSKAQEAYKRALEGMPNNAEALLQLGNITDRKGQSSTALKYYQRAARADPNLGEAVCKAALAAAKGRVTARHRAGLRSCVKLKSSPEDLKGMAEEMLSTPSKRR